RQKRSKAFLSVAIPIALTVRSYGARAKGSARAETLDPVQIHPGQPGRHLHPRLTRRCPGSGQGSLLLGGARALRFTLVRSARMEREPAPPGLASILAEARLSSP